MEESDPQRSLPRVEPRSGSGLAIPAVILVVAGAAWLWFNVDTTPDDEREYDHWLQMCVKAHGERTCREFADARHAPCYRYSNGKIASGGLRERSVEALNRGAFMPERYMSCLDEAVRAGLARRESRRAR